MSKLIGKLYALEKDKKNVITYELDQQGKAVTTFIEPGYEHIVAKNEKDGIEDTYHELANSKVFPAQGEVFIRTIPFAFRSSYFWGEIEEI